DRFAFGDVEHGADMAKKFAVLGKARTTLVQDPTVFAVMSAQTVFDLDRPSRSERGIPGLLAMLVVIEVHVLHPTVTEILLQRSPGEFQPTLVDERTLLVGARDPEQHGRAVGQGAK